MAAVLKISPSTVMRHWHANGLKPHLVRGFKVSRDPQFADKLVAETRPVIDPKIKAMELAVATHLGIPVTAPPAPPTSPAKPPAKAASN